MYASVQALLAHIVDYAGTFPPASLPLDTSVRNFGKYLQEPQAWLLGRLICPADRLSDIVPLVQEITLPDRTIALSILGRGGKNETEFFDNVDKDTADMLVFAGALPGLVRLEGYEVRVPAPFFDPPEAPPLHAALATLSATLDKTGLPLAPFVEASAPHRAALQTLITALQQDRASLEAAARKTTRPCGLKLRTGGLEPAAFPGAELVAAILAGCRKTQVPFKATAGLHHPIRRFDKTVQAKVHGFINVFVAACLSHAHDLPVVDLQSALEEEDAGAFVLDDGGITWRGHRLSNEQIAKARTMFISFGSCSFDEPRDDLRTLRWL
ncbi:MAG: hypothetical protein U0793_07040 [Gemmataceae bacterium]